MVLKVAELKHNVFLLSVSNCQREIKPTVHIFSATVDHNEMSDTAVAEQQQQCFESFKSHLFDISQLFNWPAALIQ